MESTSPRNSLTGHSLKWRFCSLVWPIFLLTKASFDPLGRYQSGFRLPSLEMGEGRGRSQNHTPEKKPGPLQITQYSLSTTNTTTPADLCRNVYWWNLCLFFSSAAYFLSVDYLCIPVDFGVDSLPLVLRVQFWQGRRPAPWGCFLYSISKYERCREPRIRSAVDRNKFIFMSYVRRSY